MKTCSTNITFKSGNIFANSVGASQFGNEELKSCKWVTPGQIASLGVPNNRKILNSCKKQWIVCNTINIKMIEYCIIYGKSILPYRPRIFLPDQSHCLQEIKVFLSAFQQKCNQGSKYLPRLNMSSKMIRVAIILFFLLILTIWNPQIPAQLIVLPSLLKVFPGVCTKVWQLRV